MSLSFLNNSMFVIYVIRRTGEKCYIDTANNINSNVKLNSSNLLTFDDREEAEQYAREKTEKSRHSLFEVEEL